CRSNNIKTLGITEITVKSGAEPRKALGDAGASPVQVSVVPNVPFAIPLPEIYYARPYSKNIVINFRLRIHLSVYCYCLCPVVEGFDRSLVRDAASAGRCKLHNVPTACHVSRIVPIPVKAVS